MSGPSMDELAQWEELVKEREEAVEQRERALRMREESMKKREEAVGEREVAATMREGVLKKREEALKKHAMQTKQIRASAAGSSSLPHQPPPPGPATHIHDLPDEVLAKIFALLSLKTIVQVLSVCRRWRGVVEDWNLIKELKLWGRTFKTEEALCLIQSAPGLTSLELSDRSDAVALLDAASVRCRNLLHLSVAFSSKGISLREALRNVVKTSPHMTTLRLTYVEIANRLQFCQELGAALPDLCKLELTIDKLSDLELDALIDNCSHNQMEEFRARTSLCSDAHVEKLVQFWGHSLRVLQLNGHNLTEGALALLGGCSELRRLTLSLLCTPGDWLRPLAALSHLKDLCVHHRTEIQEDNWCRFFSQSRSSQGLRQLVLAGRTEAGDRVFATIAAFCPQLEGLDANGIYVTISGVREVLRGCRSLHKLNVISMDASAAHIVTELPRLAPQLRTILIDTDVKRALGQATLRRVRRQMPHLRIE